MRTNLGKNFWVYRFVQIATSLGYSASSIAAMWWVLGEYHQMIYVSYLMIPPLVISAFIQPLISPAGDRYNKKTLMINGLLIQGVGYVFAALVFISDEMTLSLLIAFEITATVGRVIFNTGTLGILPNLVKSENITDAVNITDRINSSMSIIGGVIGGALVTFLGVANSFVMLSCCLGAAIVLCFFIKYINPNSQAESKVKWLSDVKAGFSYTVKNEVVFGFFLYSLIIGLAFAPMLISFPFLIKEVSGLPPFYVGLLTSSMGLGIIIGSFIYPYVIRKIKKSTIVYLSSFLFFFALFIAGFFSGAFFIFLCQFMIGFSRNWINVTIDSLLLKSIPEKFRTRVLANLMFFSTINMPIAMLLSGFFIDILGVYNLLLMLSVLCFIAMLFIISNKKIRFFLIAEPEEAKRLLKE